MTWNDKEGFEGNPLGFPFQIDPLTPSAARAAEPALIEILRDAVDSGASVGFLPPLRTETASAYWRGVFAGLDKAALVLLVARRPADGAIVGTAQLEPSAKENGRHRAEVAKLLVHRRARRRGVGAELMRAAEEAARAAGRTLLVLDTATGSDAERLYQRLGWTRVGVIPDYALWPDGRPCATTYYYKRLT